MDENMSQHKKRQWHAMKTEEVLDVLKVKTKEGLVHDEVVRRQEEYGKNEIPKG